MDKSTIGKIVNIVTLLMVVTGIILYCCQQSKNSNEKADTTIEVVNDKI